MVSPPQRLTVAAGSRIFGAGDRADAAYLILSGRVELFVDGGEGRKPLAIREPDGLFGEFALVEEGVRASSAVALTDCELLPITRDHMSSRIAGIDPLLRFCVGALLERLGQTVEQMRGLGGRPQQASPAGSIWTDHVAAARDMLTFEHELRSGLKRDEFDVYYQPIVVLSDRRLAGFEALVRWRHPTRGLLQPDDFIPFAEASGAISEVTAFCLRKVAATLPAFRAAGLRGEAGNALFLSVNVSGLDLARPAFAAEAASILCDGGVDPEDVRLEITESILMADAQRCAQTLANCRDQGFTVAIDDFGTGYSSLNYLSTLPVSVLKMDRSFTGAMTEGTAGRKIVGAILRLGSELGLSVIAEGIEDEAQMTMLQSMGCTMGQGYLFGRALDREGTLRLIEEWPMSAPAPRGPAPLRLKEMAR